MGRKQLKYRRAFRKSWIRQRVKEIVPRRNICVQNSDKEFCGLVDCSSEEEFGQKLPVMESVSNTREDNVSEQCFHKWFITEKVNILNL